MRRGEWPAMVCIIQRLEPRISPQNHPHSPNSEDPNEFDAYLAQDPSEHGSLCLESHRLSLSLHKNFWGKNYLIQIFQS